MRFFAVLALAAAVSSASAAQLQRRQAPNYPACAQTCLVTADFGNCDPVDDHCLCSSQSFVDSVTACITKSCTGDDLKQAEAAAQGACASVGVTLTNSAPAATQTSPTASGSGTEGTPAATQSPNGASSRSTNALAALAAVGAAALVL